MREKEVMEQDKQTALEQLINNYKPIIERFAFQIGIAPMDIAMIVQNTYQKLYRKLGGQISSPLIYQTTIKVAKDYDQKRKKEQKIVDKTNPMNQLNYYFEMNDHITIHKCLQDVDMKYRIPFVLFYFHEQTNENIASALKVKEAVVEKIIQNGRKQLMKLLQQTPLKAIDENKLDSLLEELKYYYEQLPEFEKMEAIMTQMAPTKSNQLWRKVFPPLVGISGLVIFSIFSFVYLDKEKQQRAAEEINETVTEETVVEETATSPTIDPEIEEYFHTAKEKFRKELGFENVDDFSLITMVESSLYDNAIDMPVDMMKEQIDYLLTTPSMQYSKIVNHSDPARLEEDFYIYTSTVGRFQYDFQEYFSQLLTENRVDMDSQLAIYELQDEVELYDGPDAIKDFMKAMNEQGYEIKLDSEMNYLSIQIDVEYIIEKVSDLGLSEGYIKYLDVMFTYQYDNMNSMDWKEYDTVLLEIEDLLKTYGNDYSHIIESNLYYMSAFYLESYLRVDMGARPLSKEDQLEFNTFLEENPDSVFWDIVQHVESDWEANEWKKTSFEYADATVIQLLFDERFHDVSFQDVVTFNRWPIHESTNTVYEEYSNTLNPDLLNEFTPLDVASLFMYTHYKGETNVYRSLYSSDSKWLAEEATSGPEIKWWDYRDDWNYLVVDYKSEEMVVVYIVGNTSEIMILESIQLKKEDGLWKVFDFSIHN